MDLSLFEPLIGISKKADASKEKKEQFNTLLLQCIKEYGYSEDAEKYFMEGFSFSGQNWFQITS